MIDIKQDSIVLGTSVEVKPTWKIWGTTEYEESLAAKFPEANRSTINSLIQTTRRIVETERQKRLQ